MSDKREEHVAALREAMESIGFKTRDLPWPFADPQLRTLGFMVDDDLAITVRLDLKPGTPDVAILVRSTAQAVEEKPEPEPERIEAAAIYRSGESYSLPRPARHSDVMDDMERMGITPPIRGLHGFMTCEGRFVGRKLAKKLARKAGQLLPTASEHEDLHSEDVW